MRRKTRDADAPSTAGTDFLPGALLVGGARATALLPRIGRRLRGALPARTGIARARTAERPPLAQGPDASVPSRVTRSWRLHRSILGLSALVVIAALSLLYPSSPGYDPWAWIIWGREVAELDLSTDNGPSWKPLPVLFTTVFSFAGDDAPDLWLLVARVGGLVAVVMAYRVAARLAGSMRILAGLVAALGVLLVADFFALVAAGWSELLLAGFVLLALERHLDGRRGAAFGLMFAAALIRAEMWPFLALYGAYVWRRDPSTRYLVAALLLLVPVLWFGPDLVAARDPLRSQVRAQQPLPGRPALAERPALEVLRQGEELVLRPIQVLATLGFAVATVAFARRRSEAATLVLALGCVAWVAIVAVMAEVGYTGNPRYLVPAAAFVCVLAGVGAARAAEGARIALARLWKRPVPMRPTGLAASLALFATLVPAALPALERLDAGAKRVRSQAELPVDLDHAVRLAGGRERVLACGDVFTGAFEVPVVAWTLHLHMRDVSNVARPPGVIFRVDPKAAGSASGSVLKLDRRFQLVARTPHWDVLTSCRR
ncbi:MAG: hypothetical protein M3304_02870 [Actinomycetota bacterium]|nr:hypothetical protein [Actinomycetota bacterium]